MQFHYGPTRNRETRGGAVGGGWICRVPDTPDEGMGVSSSSSTPTKVKYGCMGMGWRLKWVGRSLQRPFQQPHTAMRKQTQLACPGTICIHVVLFLFPTFFFIFIIPFDSALHMRLKEAIIDCARLVFRVVPRWNVRPCKHLASFQIRRSRPRMPLCSYPIL